MLKDSAPPAGHDDSRRWFLGFCLRVHLSALLLDDPYGKKKKSEKELSSSAGDVRVCVWCSYLTSLKLNRRGARLNELIQANTTRCRRP